MTSLPLSLKENREREAKEAARRRRMQELEEQKRHSWAGGEQVGGNTMKTMKDKHEMLGLQCLPTLWSRRR